jgi:hypothetical protein
METPPKKEANQSREKQLTWSEEFEDDLVVMAYPWAKSCKKIKRVLDDFFKNS